MDPQRKKPPDIGTQKLQPDLSDAPRANRSPPPSPSQQPANCNTVNNIDNRADHESDVPTPSKPKVDQSKPGLMHCDMKNLIINKACVIREVLANTKRTKRRDDGPSACVCRIVNNIDNGYSPQEACKSDVPILTELELDQNKPGLMHCDMKTLLINKACTTREILADGTFTKRRD